MDENPKFGIKEVFDEAGGSVNIYCQGQNLDWSFIKIIQRIRTGAEKYSGLIADQKFAGRTEIDQKNILEAYITFLEA